MASSKTVMICGYYGFENLGDELILAVLIAQLKAVGHKPIVLSANPQLTFETHAVESIDRMNVSKIWETLDRVDAFISGGGGLFQDSTSFKSPLYYAGVIEMARMKRKPVAFFGQGIGPLNTWFGRELTKRALKQSDLVVVRDVKSQVMVQNLADKKSQLMADSVWLWQPEMQASQNPAGRLGISLRPWPELKDEYIVQLAKCIAKLPDIQTHGVSFIDCQAGSDIVPLAKLEKVLKQYHVPFQWCMGANAIKGIQEARGIIAMRFHATLLAAKFGVPVFVLSYDPKVEGLAAQLKLHHMPVKHLEDLTVEQLNQGFDIADLNAMQGFQNDARKGVHALLEWLMGV